MMSITEFAAFTVVLTEEIERAKRHALEKGAEIIEKEAKRVIGTYDYGWPQLAPSTQADRAQKGFPANEPLLRTGHLRDSIEHTIESSSVAYIGSNEMIAVYQELGTSTIPPRPFLSAAAVHKQKELGDVLRRFTVEAIK